MHITFWLVIAEPLTWYWVAKLENNIIEFDAQPVSALSAQIRPWARQQFGTTQRDKGSYVFFDRSMYVDNEMR